MPRGQRLHKSCAHCQIQFPVWESVYERTHYCSRRCRDDAERGSDVSCAHCGKAFYVPRCLVGTRRYCSYSCRWAKHHVYQDCAHCHKRFRVQKNQVGRKRFCSRECLRAGRMGEVRHCRTCGKDFYTTRARLSVTFHCSAECTFAAGRMIHRCEQCGKEVTMQRTQGRDRRFCSQACQGKAAVIPPTPRICEQCGGEFFVKNGAVRNEKARFCSTDCFSDWKRIHWCREANPHWRGGFRYYRGASWDAARDAARARDVVCRICGKSAEENGRELDVHHLIPFRLFGLERHEEANQLENLLTLCQCCHAEVEWKDLQIEPPFHR
jgi:HNH endonuclease